MRDTRGTAIEEIGVGLDARDEGLHRRQRLHVRGDDGALGEEEREIRRLQIVRVRRRLAESDDARDDEQETGILLRLDATARVSRVLDGERVEAEQLGEERGLRAVRDVEVHPQCSTVRVLEGGAKLVGRELALDLSRSATKDAVRCSSWHVHSIRSLMRWARNMSSMNRRWRAQRRGRYVI